MPEPVSAERAAAEGAQAVERLSAPPPVMGGWLDTTEIPLAVVHEMTEDQMRALAGWLGQHLRYGEHVRRAVGAYLHLRRAAFKRGEWTPYVAELAAGLGIGSDTLGRWMLEAERHYQLGPPKGANPTRRETRAGASKSIKPAAGGDLATPPAGRDGIATASAAAPGGDDSPGAGATDALASLPDTATLDDASGGAVRGGPVAPTATGAGFNSPATPAWCDIGAKAIPADVTPPDPDLDPVTDALAELMAAPSVVLAIVARDHRGTVLAVQRALAQALTDSESRPPRGGLRPAATAPVALSRAACEHPRDKRQVKSYATICGACGVRVR